MLVLLTAFSGNNNSSKHLLDKISGENIVKKLLTNSFDGCEREIVRYIREYGPKYVISFGQKPRINKLYIETRACCHDLYIDTSFDVSLLKESLKTKGLPFMVSENAGNFLCNYVYFKGMEFLNQSMSKTKMIFIHVPKAKQFQNIDSAALWLRAFCDALERA